MTHPVLSTRYPLADRVQALVAASPHAPITPTGVSATTYLELAEVIVPRWRRG